MNYKNLIAVILLTGLIAQPAMANKSLINAAQGPNLKKLKKLIGKGGYIDTSDKKGRTLIMLAALKKIKATAPSLSSSPLLVNLGTGRGYSVLEIVQAFEEVSGQTIPYRVVNRRPGDIAECYADPSLAQQLLEWKTLRSLSDMCADTWKWQCNNPNGFP